MICQLRKCANIKKCIRRYHILATAVSLVLSSDTLMFINENHKKVKVNFVLVLSNCHVAIKQDKDNMFCELFKTETSSDLYIYWLRSNHDCYKVPITRLGNVYTINSSYTPGMKICIYARREFVFKRIISVARIQKIKMPKDFYSVDAFGLVIFLVPSNSLPLDILLFLWFFFNYYYYPDLYLSIIFVIFEHLWTTIASMAQLGFPSSFFVFELV